MNSHSIIEVRIVNTETLYFRVLSFINSIINWDIKLVNDNLFLFCPISDGLTFIFYV